MLPTPDLSIVIVAHNGEDRVVRTVESALKEADGLEFEMLVVDNGSTDGTAAAIERLGRPVEVLRNANTGFAAGTNLALSRAHGRYALLLNPDVDFKLGSLPEFVDALDHRPEVGAASVIQHSPAGDLLHTINHFPSPLRDMGEALFVHRLGAAMRFQQAVTDPFEYTRERPADWLVGSFLMVRREAIEEIGPLDERFFLYSEETDWCLRLRRGGWDVRHLPVMTVVHHEGGYDRPDLAAQLSHSKILFAEKHFSRLGTATTRLTLALRHGLRVVLSTVPALLHRRFRTRLACEVRALAVVLRLAPPPFRR